MDTGDRALMGGLYASTEQLWLRGCSGRRIDGKTNNSC